ncbi:keratin, type I cuticular Ha4-like [Bufo gargarizans]|uniref:keratin, type I cuticular Ha4-like n=1 Tax=Bufo gargarizans TaxID=30331 RepID=UPI001CF5CB12|nr:keratin, type I cuticular Ha4-like [Bufo gargarizans]
MPIVHGSSKVSFSAHSSSGHGHGAVHCGHSYGIHHGWNNTGLLSINEKETLQHLNQRLSSYLDKVHSLEQENALLERKICEWYANNAPISLPDSSQYSRTIQEIQNMILSTTMENARLERQKDDAQQATIDLRRRYQMEVNLRNSIEFDIAEQSKALSEFNMTVQDLGRQVQCLQEELFQMKNNHAGEVSFLRQQLGARVNVEMNAAPSVDLSQVLTEVRDEYENLMERNLMEVESMFLTRSAELNQEVSIGAEQLQTTSNEIIDLKRSVQALEIELQTQMSLNNSLGSTLAETEATFSAQLVQLQCLIDNIEASLAQIRSTLERQNYQYQLLMDQKNQLDMEISTYRHLLDGHNIQSAEPSTSDVTNRRPLEEEKAPPLTVPAKRFRKEKTRFSPSQQSTKRRIKLSDAQRGSRASDKHRNRLQQFLQPTAKSAARSSTVKPATATRDSSAGLVPKKENNSYRLIHNLSFPKDGSLNDTINKEWSTVHYATLDMALSMLRKAGRNAQLAKTDIKSAFRLLPINPDGYT